jgi:N-acetylmuramoyl-L-alanine amidase
MFDFGNGEVIYEGVSNRDIKNRLISFMKSSNLKYIDVCPSELDIPLDLRVDIINEICKEYGRDKCVLISLHSNASESHEGRGFEVWTSVGETKSDKYAEILAKQLIHDFPDIRWRKDTVTGELDKESQFYILRWTKCPAILPECLFFDNYDDYKRLKDIHFKNRYAQAIVNFMLRAELKL